MADNLALQIAFKSIFSVNRTDESLPWIFDGYDLKKQFFILTAQGKVTEKKIKQHLIGFFLYRTLRTPNDTRTIQEPIRNLQFARHVSR